MKNAFIIHGAYGSPNENWIPWLKNRLESNGYSVIAPKFPTPENQNYECWMEVMQPHFSEFNNETVLIGHSIGATFVLSILEKLNLPISHAILISGFLGSLDNEEFDTINKTMSEREFDWKKIQANSPKFSIFHGGNDPYVSKEKAIELGEHLSTEPIFIENGGHLNESAGFLEFPLLLEEIRKYG